jgi:hypothetical protein
MNVASPSRPSSPASTSMRSSMDASPRAEMPSAVATRHREKPRRPAPITRAARSSDGASRLSAGSPELVTAGGITRALMRACARRSVRLADGCDPARAARSREAGAIADDAKCPENPGSRRPDSNRGPFHYECGSVRERRRQATTNGQRTRRKASALRVTRAHRWAVVAGEICVFYTSAARCPVLDLAHR